MDLISKVKRTILKYNLITNGDKVLIAVSGGPDSVALLDILFSLREELKIELFIAHLNHGFRPESVEEASFVEGLAEGYGLSIIAAAPNVKAAIEQKGLSLQEGAREVRYEFLDQSAVQMGANKIAVGHHADDQAETVLYNFLRGAGIKGLGGMAPQRGNVIRPLIELSRKEIEEYCEKRRLKFCLDPSNQKQVYLRNKIRLGLIPYLEKEYNPQIRPGISRMSEVFRDEEAFINEKVNLAWDDMVLSQDNRVINLDRTKFIGAPKAIQRRIIRKGWALIKIEKYGLAFEHVERVLDFLTTNMPGSRLQLPGEVFLFKDEIRISFKLEEKGTFVPDFSYPLQMGHPITINELGLRLTAWIESTQGDTNANYDLDYERVPDDLVLRNRRQGDLWKNSAGTKKLKDYLIDCKIPKEERDKLLLLAKDNLVIWCQNIGVGYPWRVNEGTARLLRLEIQSL